MPYFKGQNILMKVSKKLSLILFLIPHSREWLSQIQPTTLHLTLQTSGFNIWYQSQVTNNPPPTRSTTHDDYLSALEVSNHSIQRQFDIQKEEFTKEFTNIKESVEALSNTIAQMGQKMERMDNQNSNFEEGSASHNRETKGGLANQKGGTFRGIQNRFSRVDFPQFNGEDPTGWIYKAEKFFRYQRTADNEKVLLASFNLQDEALQRY